MDELSKRIELMRKELSQLEALKAKYEINPMDYLIDQVSYMRAQKHVSAEQIINTVINYVKTHGFN